MLSKKEKKIVYHSFPDFSDNSFATFIYATKNLKNYKNIWLVDNIKLKERYLHITSNYADSSNLVIVKKKSLIGVYHYLTSNLVFHTHGLYNVLGIINNQKKVNLWHGMPIKNIGYLDNPDKTDVQLSNYHTATSTFYQEILSRAFGVKPEKVLIVGQTRNDLLYDTRFTLHQLFNDSNQYSTTVLWMPTYRKSVIGDIRVDGDITNANDFLSEKSLNRLNLFLRQKESMCYVKLHPMDYRTVNSFQEYSNIRFIDNTSFESKGINMYSTFSTVDILLTDFSSIYIDFLLLNKPIGFVFSDFDAFKNTRGFLFDDPRQYMPGEIITTQDKLEEFLSDIFNSKADKFIKQRQAIKNKFHHYSKDFSKELMEKLAIKD